MNNQFWQLVLVGFIGSMIGRFLFRLRKRKSGADVLEEKDLK